MNRCTVQLDVGDATLVNNPYEFFRYLRNESPIAELYGHEGVWIVSRYPDIKEVLGAPSFRSRPVDEVVPSRFVGTPTEIMWKNNLAFLEGSRHSRVRKTLIRPLNSMSGNHVESIVRDVVRRAVTEAVRKVSVDGCVSIATKIPQAVICLLLRITNSEFDQMAVWTRDFLRIFLPEADDEETSKLVNNASMGFVTFLGDLIDRCAADPADSLIDHLIQQNHEGNLSSGELVATLRGVFTAGFETTAGTISGLLLALSRDLALLSRLRSDPSCIPAAVDEGLRWESPVQVVVRYLERDSVIGGCRIPKGARLWLLLGSANHDDQIFGDPERFCLDRSSMNHLAFGGGRHKCAGLGLARLELASFLSEFSRLVSEVKVDEEQVCRHMNLQFRSLSRLPLELVPLKSRETVA